MRYVAPVTSFLTDLYLKEGVRYSLTTACASTTCYLFLILVRNHIMKHYDMEAYGGAGGKFHTLAALPLRIEHPVYIG